MQSPTHPETETDSAKASGRSWRSVALIVVVVVLLGALVALHLTGAIGPGLHRDN